MTRQIQRSPSLAEVVTGGMDSRLLDVHTAMPGKVDSYDATTQRADVTPMIQRNHVTSEGVDVTDTYPPLLSIPVIFPRAGDFFISLPIAVGDHVLLLFNEQAIDRFYGGEGVVTDPLDLRRHHLADAVCIPGFYPAPSALKEASATDLTIGVDQGTQVHVRKPDADPVRVRVTDETAAVEQSLVLAEKLEALYTTALTGIKAAFDSHTHATGTGPSGPPESPPGVPITMPPYSAAMIHSAKVKIPDN